MSGRVSAPLREAVTTAGAFALGLVLLALFFLAILLLDRPGRYTRPTA